MRLSIRPAEQGLNWTKNTKVPSTVFTRGLQKDCSFITYANTQSVVFQCTLRCIPFLPLGYFRKAFTIYHQMNTTGTPSLSHESNKPYKVLVYKIIWTFKNPNGRFFRPCLPRRWSPPTTKRSQNCPFFVLLHCLCAMLLGYVCIRQGLLYFL